MLHFDLWSWAGIKNPHSIMNLCCIIYILIHISTLNLELKDRLNKLLMGSTEPKDQKKYRNS